MGLAGVCFCRLRVGSLDPLGVVRGRPDYCFHTSAGLHADGVGYQVDLLIWVYPFNRCKCLGCYGRFWQVSLSPYTLRYWIDAGNKKGGRLTCLIMYGPLPQSRHAKYMASGKSGKFHLISPS